MAAESRDRFSVLRHPLFLMVVASVIGSFMIPWISHKTDRNRALGEARLKKKVEIINKNTETISKLNVLVTWVGTFHKDNIRLKPSPPRFAELQDKLREDMNMLYADFERAGWWWYRNLNDEAVILEIVPQSGSDKLKHDVNLYGENIEGTVKALNEFRHKCLSKEYDFEENGKVTKIQKEMSERLNQLANERVILVSNLVQDFDTP